MRFGIRIFLFIALLAWPRCLFAAQVHSAPEGLFVHQIGHLFFIFSMGILIYWLRGRQLTHQKGWQRLQYAAFFFVLWNIDTLLAHFIESRPGIFSQISVGSWQAQIVSSPGNEALTVVYYLTKMDHLLCVPAIIFLYLALRELLKDAGPEPGSRRPA